MPIYEFYCERCHRVFNFLSRQIDTRKRPACPRCGRPRLERKPSRFAVSRGLEEPDGSAMPDLDESKLEQAMEALAGEMEGVDEDDPRQAARLMRKLYDTTGLELGPAFEEAMRRMEAGEDPDRIESEMGDLLEEEDPLAPGGGRGLKGIVRRFVPPAVDETLHEM